MFSKLFKKSEPKKPKSPEIMGLYLGGSFELDNLKLSLLEPELTIEGAARSQLIQAVGEAPLDTGALCFAFTPTTMDFYRWSPTAACLRITLPMLSCGTFMKRKPLVILLSGTNA